jgi:hypothetical protein
LITYAIRNEIIQVQVPDMAIPRREIALANAAGLH